MTNREALEILGLGRKANDYELEERYARLVKGYGRRQDLEGKAQMERINAAYRHLKGDDVPHEPEKASDRKVIAGKRVYDWKNLVYYGWKPALLILLVVLLLAGVLYSMLTNKRSDFHVAVIGKIIDVERLDTSQTPKEHPFWNLEDYLKSKLPTVQHPSIEFLTLGSQDGQFEMATMTKRSIYLAGQQPTEILLLDPQQFDVFQKAGLLAPMDADWEALLKQADQHAVEELFTAKKAEEIDIEGPELKPTGRTRIYGLDTKNSHLFEAFGIFGNQVILARLFRSDHAASIEAFLSQLLQDREALRSQIQAQRQASREVAESQSRHTQDMHKQQESLRESQASSLAQQP